MFAPRTSVGIVILMCVATGDIATAVADDLAVAATRQELQRAEARYHSYRQVEYPRERRHLRSQITVVSREIELLQVRIREYRRFERNRYSNPLLVSLQNAELLLLDAKLRLKNLQAEQRSMIRSHPDRCRQYELEIELAEARLATLEGR